MIALISGLVAARRHDHVVVDCGGVGYRPAVSLAEGIARFAAWVRAQPIYEDGLDRANRELADRGLMRAQPAC